MPEQPEENKETPQPSNLADRVARYRKEVERVVHEVGEHPQYEMKRSCSLTKLSEKIEFVKDFQSIATSKIEGEKYLVIGADDKTKSFVPVNNRSEFDEASVRQILERYLAPVPQFEVFQLESSDGKPFILFVIPKQLQRRILAKATVYSEEAQDSHRILLIREGDLWTKGSSTGKRLAKVEDWNDIYEEVIEGEAERRARVRTAHTIEMAIAREKVKPVGRSSLPSSFTDEEFFALMEDICSARDEARLKVLLERLRDDSVEGWHVISAYEDLFSANPLANPAEVIPDAQRKVREHIKNVLRPSVRWLTLAGILVVKNTGPIPFLNAVVDLLTEVFDTTHALQTPRRIVPYGQTSKSIEDHNSHTVPALESLIALHLVGAYTAKRKRFGYLRSQFRGEVFSTSWQGQQWQKRLMAFWPFDMDVGYGEPAELRTWGGRIRICASRAKTDGAYGKLFGSEKVTIDALCQYEFCLELNSYLAMPQLSPETGAFVKQQYPNIDFAFRPDITSFPMEALYGLARVMLAEIKNLKPGLLRELLFDPQLVPLLFKPGADRLVGAFLDSLSREHIQLWIAQHHFPPDSDWPLDVGKELKRLRESSNQ